MYRLLLLASLCIAACSTISRFDHYSYVQTTSLKVDALNVMSLATQPWSLHKPEAMKVVSDIDKIYEYEKNKPKNAITEKMWFVIKDSSGHLFGGFVKRWQQEGQLDAVFVNEAHILVGESFDQISQLESGKIKSAQITN